MLENQKDYNHLLVSQAAGQGRKKRVILAVIALAIAVLILTLFFMHIAIRT